MGGKFHLKLNMGTRPIANKYREGKMKRTLKRELKVREIVERETLETSNEQLRSPVNSAKRRQGTLGVSGQHQFGLQEKAQGNVADFSESVLQSLSYAASWTVDCRFG